MKPITPSLLNATRTLHIYLSIFALVLLLFFGTTGFMMNHEDWFGLDEPRTQTVTASLPPALLKGPDQLAIVEKLRADFAVIGALDDFQVEDDQLRLTFKSPGQQARIVIGRADGAMELTTESSGPMGRLTALHRGQNAAFAWRRIIDGTAVLLALSVFTGLVLWFSLPRRRTVGILVLLASLLACGILFFLSTPK